VKVPQQFYFQIKIIIFWLQTFCSLKQKVNGALVA